MKIRIVEPRDRRRLVDMGMRFFKSSPYYGLLGESDVEGFGRLVDAIVGYGAHACLLVAVDDDDVPFGMIAAVASLHPFNGGLVAEEMVWWVEPEARDARMAGPKLLELVEQWATRIGARCLKMVAPAGHRTVERFYRRVGYLPIESAFVKALV